MSAPSKRRRREIETPEFAAMLRRMIRTYAARVADADEVDLAEMDAMRETLDQALIEAVRGQRAGGASWADIGAGLGTTRQAAHARFARHIKDVSLISAHDHDRSA